MPEPQHRSDSGSAPVVLAVTALLFVMVGLAVVAWYAGSDSVGTQTVTVASPAPSQAAVSPTVAAGAHDFVQFGCGQCHGLQGSGGVSPYVPALDRIRTTLTTAQLTDIIEHGAGVSDNPKQPYMPVWHGVVSKRQITDLVSYIHAGLPAVAGATPVLVPANQGQAVEGQALYVRDGCINCHGPNALGGVPNPSSPDKTIPPLSGADFRSEFDTPKKIEDVILSGSVLGRAPIVSMPHWGGILSERQLAALVAYLQTLS